MRSLFSGEGSIAERKLQLNQLRDICPSSKHYNLMSMEPAVFAAVEPVLLQEALNNASSSGRLYESSYRDDAGRKVTTYQGDPIAWMKHCMSPGIVATIDLQAGTHEETIRIRDGQRIKVI